MNNTYIIFITLLIRLLIDVILRLLFLQIVVSFLILAIFTVHSSSYVSIKTVANLIFYHLFVLLFKRKWVVPSLTRVIPIIVKKFTYLRQLKIFRSLKTRPTLPSIELGIKMNMIKVARVVDAVVLIEGCFGLVGDRRSWVVLCLRVHKMR